MNQIEKLRDDLGRRFPELKVTIDAPGDPQRGTWHLDIERPGALPLVVEWRPDRGFGVSAVDEDDPAYGAGPEEVYPNVCDTLARVTELVKSGSRPAPPLTVQLAELRRRRGLTQAELAQRAGVKQSNISQIERRDDLMLRTLATYVSAMGGSLHISAQFPDGTASDLTIGATDALLAGGGEKNRPACAE
jgi:DNA-binding XRE family transcriptional regulator